MLQPKSLMMKRGALLGWEPRVDREVFATIDSPDFASGISVVFSGCCPSTVSNSETVFLCPLRSAAATMASVPAGSPFLRLGLGPIRLPLFV
ncbi:hypothetical protein [Hymenobacter wooponensis]|uniref:Uncharacterized protein n=1 Tax=Hymenobacter wooponensis TaxID=1525360 RepID=A0A4Z0ME20_9BACT|nr:hypothetical protein [Hymenobacter wooponensis]TGD77597.1 hypothetical protein EU557_22745 [Hymenobacter wooponensis]